MFMLRSEEDKRGCRSNYEQHLFRATWHDDTTLRFSHCRLMKMPVIALQTAIQGRPGGHVEVVGSSGCRRQERQQWQLFSDVGFSSQPC